MADIALFCEDHIQFITLGDTFTRNYDQLEVLERMEKVCEVLGCDLVSILGGNFYPSGVVSADDLKLKTKIE